MLTAEQNELLTRIGPGTSMGEYFRRFWTPALLDQDLPGPDCDPVRLRILGEDLVAFRDTAGNVGVLDAYCPHRRAPLYFGRNEECGLRCVYHGRKFDTNGECVDYPSAPDGSKLKERGGTKAYPTFEAGGLIWIYMGPSELMPDRPPDLPFMAMPRDEIVVFRYFVESNWLQNLEGDLDLEHLNFLHGQTLDELGFEGMLREDGVSTDRFAKFETLDTEYGMAASCRWRKSNGEYYWRVNQHILPSHMQIPLPIGHSGETSLWVPADDRHTWRILVFGKKAMPMVPGPDGELIRLEEFIEVERGTFVFPDGVVVDAPLPAFRKQNDYGLDRERQRTRTFTGLPTVLTEDQALTEGMGAIHDRTKENLDATDLGLINLRQRLLRAVEEFAAGREPSQPQQPEIFDVEPLDTDTPIEHLTDLLASHHRSVVQARA